MFVRKKKNPSGSISVQIIKKVNGKSKVIKTLGCSKDEEEINRLVELGKKQIKELEPNLFEISEKEQVKREFISFRNDQIIPIGDELFIGKIYDRLGLANIFKDIKSIRYKEEKEFLFRSLVLSRILYPGSKLYLIDYLWYFKQKEINTEKIYRFLDTLYKDEIKRRVEESIFNYTLSKIDNNLVVSFYDVTTLHFESESEDDLRRVGFSKEGKLNRPQIQLGLLTTLEGFPLAYEVYEGNRFEGHTLIETLKKFEKRFNLKQKPIIVADRGMLSNCNIIELKRAGYKYIIAARIKSLKDSLKEKIANIVFLSDMDTKEILLDEELICKEKSKIKDKVAIQQRLILSYSTQRAKKDRYLRERALKKLKEKIEKSNNITKSDLKLSHYAKFLDLDNNCNVEFKINQEMISQDEKLDGIKGFTTNDFSLSHQEIIEHYKNLWQIEKAFRISKTDLKIRPIYHRLEDRIKAHILIAFVAYTIYIEFEQKTKAIKMELNTSYKIIREIIKHTFAVKIDNQVIPLQLSPIQQKLYNALNMN